MGFFYALFFLENQIEEIYKAFLDSSGVVTDTRKISQNSMFFALKGENFDGNKFVKEALDKGAKWAISDDITNKDVKNVIIVEDALKTLQLLASHHRRQFSIPFLGITGSNGKTTTKELVRDVLLKKYNVLATVGNLNNHIGVPLTLLDLKPEHDFAIIEMGANHVGEIKELCEIADPDYGLITNIGKAHLEGFGSVEGIKKGKSELYKHVIRKGGLLFINSDDNVLNELVGEYQQVFNYGSESNVKLELHRSNPDISLTWNYDERDYKLSSHLYGEYNFQNISAAIAIGCYFEVSADDINHAISNYRSTINRSQVIEKGGIRIYLDAYNANPTSMQNAITSFFSQSGTNAMILGDMLELGIEAGKEHHRVFELLKDFKGNVYYVGAIFKDALSDTNAITFSTTEKFTDWLKNNPIKANNLLIKGSRKLKLESVLEYLPE